MNRSIDILFCTVGMVLLVPLYLALAVAIRCTSPGPAIYAQIRIGKDARPFRLYKFRSMVCDADRDGDSITTSSDNRVTPLGRFLRRTKLDELPQLWNVLVGDMSLVGPRPDVPEIVAQYSPQMRHILDVRPGITSVASLALRDEEGLLALARNKVQAYTGCVVPAKVSLAMEHVLRRSFWFDMSILCRTVFTLVPVPGKKQTEHEIVARLRREIAALNASVAGDEYCKTDEGRERETHSLHNIPFPCAE